MQPTTPPPPPPPLQGLDAREAAERLRRFGPNDTGEGRKRGWLGAVKTVAGEPMFLLLLRRRRPVPRCSGISAKACCWAVFAVRLIGLVMAQQHRSERALDGVARTRPSPHAR
jgi:hypothetical protein